MPSNPLDQTISLSGADQVKAQLSQLGASGSADLKKLSDSASAAQAGFTEFGGGVGQLASIISGAREQVEKTSEGFEGIGEALLAAAPALSAFLGLASAGGLFELAQSASEAIDVIDNMSAALGSTAEEFQAFQYAMASVGQSSEVANNSLLKMTAYIGSTDEAIKKLDESSQALALSQEVATKSADLSVTAAQNSAASSAQAYIQSQQAITNAQKALNTAPKSGFQQALDNLTNSQVHGQEALNNYALASQRVSLAEDQRRAAMAKAEAEQDKGLKSTQQWLKEIGVASASSSEGTTNAVEAFYKIQTALAGISDAADRATKERDIFGRGFSELADALQAPLGELKKFSDQFGGFGFSVNEDVLKTNQAFRSAAFQFKFFADSIKNFAGLDIASKVFTPLLTSLNQWITTNASGIKAFFEGFANALQIVGTVVSTLLVPAFAVGTAAFHALAIAANAVAGIINKIFGTQVTGPTALWVGIIAGAAAKFAPFIGSITGITRALSVLNLTWTAGAKAFAIYTAEGYSAAGALGVIATRLGLLGLLIAGITYDLNHWDEIVAGNTAAVQGFSQLMVAVWGYIRDNVVAGFNLWAQDFQNAFAAMGAYFSSWGDSISEKAKSIGEFFSNAWSAAVADVEDAWNGLVDWGKGIGQGIISAFSGVYQFFQKLASLIESVTGASADAGAGNFAPGFARGGAVRGPGTSTSDSIPAMLSDGEFVINHDAVRRIGVSALNAINSGRAAFSSFGNAFRMARGGLVDVMRPRYFASGGLAVAGAGNPGGHSIVNLTIGGGTFSLIGEKGVVQALTSAARKASITSAGRAPSWKR